MYEPTSPAQINDLDGLRKYVEDELRQLSNRLTQMQTPRVSLAELHVEPARPRDGMTVFADGSDWNPGAGRGLYAFYGSVWHPIGTQYSVANYGATGDGSDQTAAFKLAAAAATAAYNTQSSWENATNPEQATVYIPPGNYLLSDFVGEGGNLINWVADDGAFFVSDSQNYLGNASLIRPRKLSAQAVGTQNSATTLTVTQGIDHERPAAITGLTSDSQLATSAERGACALALIAQHSKVYSVTTGTTTYTSTTLVTTMTPTWDVNELVKGMIIQVPAYSSDAAFAGRLTSWSADGKTLTVSGWFEVGNTAAGQVPTNGAPAYINYHTKVWAGDALVRLNSTDVADWACGWELNLENLKADYDPATGANDIGGFDVGSAGAGTNYNHHYGFRARENGYYGFVTEGAVEAAFAVDTPSDSVTPNYGFFYRANTTSTTKYPVEIQRKYSGTYRTVFRVNVDGTLEIGRTDATDLPGIDFHSSGNAVDYDARIQCSGGSSTAGAGELFLNAATTKVKDTNPNASATHDLGNNTVRWRYLYAGNAILYPASSVTPANNGALMFELTSNTQLKIKVKGSDGTVRSVSLTLA